jgi:hypothetical protein
MKILSLSALALIAGAPLLAQGGYVYSPPGCSTTEQTRYCYYFLRYANGQSQLLDGEHRGTTRTITEIALRPDYYSFNTTYGMGRTWTRMTIKMCEGDYDTFGSTISANRKTPQTQVFAAAVTLPTLSGYPKTQPEAWGGTTGTLKFPFTTKYAYSGKADLLSEWMYAGGTLANRGSWSGSTYKYYRQDAGDTSGLSSTGSQGSSYSYIPTTRLNNSTTSTPPRTTCNDSAITSTTGAYAYGYAYTYGKYYSNRGWAGKLRMYGYSYYTGYSRPTIHAYSYGNDPKGVDVFTGCNMLHLKTIVLMDTLTTMPQSINSSGYSGYREMFFPWLPQMASLKLTLQAAWADSKTNGFRLSQAAEITFPNGMPPPRRYAGHSYSTTTTVLNYRSTSYLYNPALRYKHD